MLKSRIVPLVLLTAAMIAPAAAASAGAHRVVPMPPDPTEPDPNAAQPEPSLPPGLHPVVVHDCNVDGGDQVAETRPTDTDPDRYADVHEIEVYQTSSDHSAGDHPTGAADVYVHATRRPQVLVLAAYEPTLWRVHADEGVEIAMVVLDGYHPQSVVGVPLDIEVVSSMNWPGIPDRRLAALSEASRTSETYCYDASLFSVRADEPTADVVDACADEVDQ